MGLACELLLKSEKLFSFKARKAWRDISIDLILFHSSCPCECLFSCIDNLGC